MVGDDFEDCVDEGRPDGAFYERDGSGRPLLRNQLPRGDDGADRSMVDRETEGKSQQREQAHTRPKSHACVGKAQFAGMLHCASDHCRQGVAVHSVGSHPRLPVWPPYAVRYGATIWMRTARQSG